MDAPASITAEPRARFAASLEALAPVGRIGVAVSGGPDSLALLLLCHAARPNDIVAATVDHGLRADAADEAAMVAAICATIGVPHATLTVKVPDDPAGIQAAARHARYAAMGCWARREHAEFLATAHHTDDQAETLLMRMARGAGLGGLAGVRRSRPLDEAAGVVLIRPLLDWRKTELETLVAASGLVPARDPSNADSRFDRTRARTLLARGWPDAGRMAASARHLAEAEDALVWSAALLARERITIAADAGAIDATGLPRELRRRLLLTTFARLAPGVGQRGDALDRVLQSLDRGKVATLGGWRCDPGPPWRIERAPPRR